ncbi:MAG TPA: hypothetical protein VGB92_21445 [Longimicrobium sp.]|jgi:hypothetical protein
MQSSSNDTPQATGTSDTGNPSAAKLAWHTPVVEEVPFTRTEAGGSGAVYDFVVYSGSA